MQTFQKIEGAVAIVRLRGGVHKQVDMFHRGGVVFVAHDGGFVRVFSEFGGVYGTSNPNVTIVEFEAGGVVDDVRGKPPQFMGSV